MPSASVLFYGNRRSRSSRSSDDLASPSDSSSHRRRHRNRTDLRRRHRLASPDDVDLSRHPSLSSPESEPRQRGCFGESSLSDISNRAAAPDMGRRFSRSNRLPGSVLLAKERLLERLRGVSISGVRQSRETSPSIDCNDFWVVDAHWETSAPSEELAANAILTDLPAESRQQFASQDTKKKPLGLTEENLSLLHHELFTEEQQNGSSQCMSKALKDCSICLENFLEGNKLTSLPCGHRFHTSCLYPWLQTCGDCPYCRSCIMLAS